jgi:hypothetical protein
MMKTAFLACTLLLTTVSTAMADIKSKVIREAAEHLLRHFGSEVAGETLETLSSKIARYGVRYGDEAIGAIRKAGSKGFKLLDDAGENAPFVIQLLNRHGADGVWVASRPRHLAIFVKYGNEAAEAMIRHPEIATDVIDQFGRPAALAMRSASSQNARRIAMMADDGSLKATGHAEEMLNVMATCGDKATQFIWANRGSLAVATAATAFLAAPEPFINGVRDLAKIAVQPVDSAAREVAREVGRGVAEGADWTLVLLCVPLLLACVLGLKTLTFPFFSKKSGRFGLGKGGRVHQTEDAV